MRTRTSFQKRQKEIARAERQRDKAAKRMQKKLVAKQHPEGEGDEADAEETAEMQLGPRDTEPGA